MKKNEIKLLDTSLLKKKNHLQKITYWLRALNRPNGWHYDLDQIWVLEELKKNKVKPGSTILDAGAGYGVMQFILADLGYNIISLDYSNRNIEKIAMKFFKISSNINNNLNYFHKYMDHIEYETNLFKKKKFKIIIKRINFKSLLYIFKYILKILISKIYLLFDIFNKKNRGQIKFIRAPIHKMPIKSNSIDAIISISAIEHADINLFDQNIREMKRVLKKKSILLITTNFTNKKDIFFDEFTQAWCFSYKFIKKKFNKNFNIYFNIKKTISSFKSSKIFFNRLDDYYTKNKNFFLYKKNIKEFPYLPMAIKIFK